ncbi:histidine phosphotransferase [Orientia tsutsugamushi str. Gilliam]|uniref:Histidine phosphotransferase n=2 Tax=Orientia tsutsugamushi str. Gilliam TaxID=1359184 RepID=A0A2U3QPZ7_ORITS|nr:histidine phosphotransferase family protein [Orientia tsutsugamushi]SPR03044.1 histidine phosphotransferase [Orientia tsutsugamushi str. Gilliam]
MNNIKLAQFISVKIFHDFAGGLGAISNGIKYCIDNQHQLNNKLYGLAFDTIKIGSTNLLVKLQLYRQMYGSASKSYGDNKLYHEANFDEIRAVLDDYFKALINTKINLVFKDEFFHVKDTNIDISTGKLLMCLVISAQDALLHGGDITVKIYRKQDKSQINILAKGKSIKNNEEQNFILTATDLSDDNITLFNVHAYYVYYLKKMVNASISCEHGEDYISYIIEQ